MTVRGRFAIRVMPGAAGKLPESRTLCAPRIHATIEENAKIISTELLSDSALRQCYWPTT